VFFIGLLVRSGIQILASYPRLFWNDDSTPGREWLKFTRRKEPTDRLWISLEDEKSVTPLIAQPGGNNLGLGRHFHFFSVVFWVLSGLMYVILLFVTGEWSRLIPTSWAIFPDALRTFTEYITFQIPPASEFRPYDPLQQLTYAAVVFLLGPFLIATGAAQPPGIEARFPWYPRIFGGRQSARSLHFLGLLAVVAFTIVHTVMVIVTGLGKNLGDIMLGYHGRDEGLSIILGIIIIAGILALYGLLSWLSLTHKRAAQHALSAFYSPPVRLLTLRATSKQQYDPSEISPFFTVNGSPPRSSEYLTQLWLDFEHYALEVTGLVEQPLRLTLADLQAMPRQSQITKHHCIQGWSAVGQWAGVPVREILARCQPLANARHVIFWSYSTDTSGQQFYESIPIEAALEEQTILAYEMNGRPLPEAHGAPLRLRCETLLGFKMCKWVCRMELVEDYKTIRGGQGGSREDNRFYEVYAGI
ncbi:MAG TPA: molybdopterin-dependent oxidoreductase, partial [Ktedonobacterales bacterium]|nr:molybdopterin-dependent oxidoreductase [Ktedonobacterales bacterium]